MFHWRSDDDGLVRGFTSREGGVSVGPYAALNLGAHVGDDPSAVAENRRLLAEAVDLPVQRVVYMDQCHGAEVAVVTGRDGVPPRVDALVTTEVGLGLAVMVADCTPVLIHDRGTDVIAAVHAGRPGMIQGVVGQAISAMRDLGGVDLHAVVGPSVCGRCYEVPAAMRASAADVSPESMALTWTGTPAIDVATGVVSQLISEGVSVEWVSGCAREDDRLYSHRRDGVTGRFAGVIARRGR